MTFQDRLSAHHHWRHQIPLPNGEITPGFIDTNQEWQRLKVTDDLLGKHVLDIGCSDGYYSYRSESEGAERIMAIDDMSSLLWKESNGFQIVHEILSSTVNFKSKSVYDLSVEVDGRFDVVFFLNVLYHLQHPMLALEKIRAVMNPGAIMYYKSYFSTNIEFQFWGRPFRFQLGKQPLAQFYPKNELAGDYTNWWGPNIPAHRAMLESSGFEIAEETFRSYDRIYYRCRAEQV